MKTNSMILAVCVLFLSGCGGLTGPDTAAGENPSLSAIQTAVMAALPTWPAVGSDATPYAQTSLATITETPIPVDVSFDASVSADTLNLRGGPSLLHNIISQYHKGEVVRLLGRAPGNEWVKAVGADNRIGWLAVTHLALPQEATNLPVLTINESLVARGRVVDVNGAGIAGIQVALTRMGGADRVRIQGTTGEDGIFYAYAPVEYQGKWLAAVVGVGCASRIVDANCRYGGAFYPLVGTDLELPIFTDLIITYK